MLLTMNYNQPASFLMNVLRQGFIGLVSLTTSVMAFGGDLTVEILGIVPKGGKVYVAVYDAPNAFPTSGRQRFGQVVSSDDARFIVHFKELPPGQYAAVAFQDLNGNGKLDKNLLGIPKEPYGFSNNVRGSMRAPAFSEAAVSLEPDGATTIVLK